MSARKSEERTVKRYRRIIHWLAFGIVAVSAALAYWATTAQIEITRWVEHTHRVIETLDDVGASLYATQNARRGFALTGADEQLRQFAQAADGLSVGEKSVRALTADNPIQQERLDRLEPLLGTARLSQEASMTRRKADGFNLDHEVAVALSVTTLLDKSRAILADLIAEERQLLVTREERMAVSVTYARLAHVIGTGVSLVVILLAFEELRRGNARLVRSESVARLGEQHLSTILYSIGDGVIATDVAGKILRINAAAQQLTGWSKDALGKML
ncbi:MAG: CHASE3 domain-containing protein, partial [Polyangiaceae bacterium]